MIVIGVATVIGAVLVGRSLQPPLSTWNASTVALLGATVLVGAILYLLPTVNEVPDGFSPILLWEFGSPRSALRRSPGPRWACCSAT